MTGSSLFGSSLSAGRDVTGQGAIFGICSFSGECSISEEVGGFLGTASGHSRWGGVFMRVFTSETRWLMFALITVHGKNLIGML